MDTGYRIGAVAKLTGISTDTIRAWERRYNVVQPNRGENNNRYYTDSHIKKLISVKRLVDAGQAIGTICRLSDEELQERTSGLLGIDRQISTGPASKWAVFSVQQPGWLKDCIEAQPDHDITWFTHLEDVDVGQYEFVVIDMPSLSEVNEKEIHNHVPRELAARCLVVYRFASRTQLRSLTARGFRLLKGPLEPYALVNLLSTDTQPAAMEISRRFSESELNRFAGLSGSVECECPKHLSELIVSLNQFEDYTRDCVNQTPEDAELHKRLLGLSCQARSIMEQALAEVIAVEGHPDHIN